MAVTETDLAYCAGLLDGEAYIGIKRTLPSADRKTPGFHARIQVRMVDEAAISFLASTLGGSYYGEAAREANRRPLFCYQASDAKAECILQSARPYLRVKRNVADVVLALRALQATARRHQTKVTGHRQMPHWTGKIVTLPNLSFSDEYVAQCDTLYREAKRLNTVGIGGKGAGYGG